MPSGCPPFVGIDTPKNCRVPDIWTGMWGVGSLEPGVWRKGSSPASESRLESGTGHLRGSLWVPIPMNSPRSFSKVVLRDPPARWVGI